MDTRVFVHTIIDKTTEGKLEWEPTALGYELVATFGREYIIRVRGPHVFEGEDGNEEFDSSTSLSLETAGGAMIIWLSTHEAQRKPGVEHLPELWEMIRCGGKSPEQAMEDAWRKLEQL